MARGHEGFSLIETLVATAILATGVGTLAQLVFMATHATERARFVSVAAIVAQDKMEALRAGAFASDGNGLALSPPGALDSNTSGFCDFLDRHGRLLAAVATAPPNTVFTRRWSVISTTTVPGLVVVQVRVAASGIDAVRLVTALAPRPTATGP